MMRLSKFLFLEFIAVVTELHSLLVSTCFCIGLNLSLSFIFSQDNGHHLHLTLPIPLNCMTYFSTSVALTSPYISHLR